jgi:hypothetical protein
VDATAARIAPHAEACLSRFERFALDVVFAQPASLTASLEAEAAQGEAAAARAYTAAQEAELDERLAATRARLAASGAALAAMRAEQSALASELRSSGGAAERLRRLAAVFSANSENVDRVCALCETLSSGIVGTLGQAEALCAAGGAVQPRLGPPGGAAAAAGEDVAARMAAAGGAGQPVLAEINARLHA